MAQSKVYAVWSGDKLQTVTYSIGDRVQLHPATDAWMSGDRFGQVRALGRHYVHVLMDRSNKVRKLGPSNILEIVR